MMQQPDYKELIDVVETLSESNLQELGLLVQQRLTVLVHQRLTASNEREAAATPAVVESRANLLEWMLALRPEIEASHERSNREALLEHARMGREVCESRDGNVVWIPPAEIFARYGLDEFGRPKPDATEAK